MSILWTITATFLYTEMGICLLFVIPLISPTRWRSIFRSRLITLFTTYANFYFGFFVLLLIVMFLDGVREIRRYNTPFESDDLKGSPLAEITQHMKLFRAQRNFYIAGFSLFLAFVLRRLLVLINNQALLQADCDAAKKQAKSATAVASQLIDSKDIKNMSSVKDLDSTKEKLEQSKKQIEKLTEELKRANANNIAMKNQAESTNREYDNILNEVSVLQEKLKKAENISIKETKKSD